MAFEKLMTFAGIIANAISRKFVKSTEMFRILSLTFKCGLANDKTNCRSISVLSLTLL